MPARLSILWALSKGFAQNKKAASTPYSRALYNFQAMTITTPMAIPIKHRLRTVVANSGSSVKNDTIIPKIPVAKIMMTPQPSAALTEPNGAFLNVIDPLTLSLILAN